MRTYTPLNFFLLMLLSLLLPSFGQSQSCAECRYVSPVFDSVTVETVQFGQGQNAEGNNQDLFLDVYQPYGDTASVRPLIIFAFGGGFIQGARDEDYVIKACERFARAGYVSFGIDYRIGFDILGVITDPTGELMRTFFRAMQDMRGSIQFANAHADTMGNSYRIDTNMIFIGGASAGAITALMVSHCDKDTEFSEMGSLNAISGLGGFYSSSGFYSGYRWDNIAGSFNIAGALINANWIEPGDPPIVSAHGDQDRTVPYAGGNFDLGIAQLGLEGSYLVDRVADSVGVCSFLYTMVGEDHPSGSASEEYYDQIFNRILPRAHTVVKGRSFCCPLGLTLDPGPVVPLLAGQQVTLNANLDSSQGNTQYLWCSLPCNTTSTQPQFTSTPAVPSYVIGMVWEGNCQATDFATFQAPVGLDEVSEASFSLFPNPASDRIEIRLHQSELPLAQFRLYSPLGQVIREFSLEGEVKTLSLQGLARGMYLLELNTGTHREVKRFLLQ